MATPTKQQQATPSQQQHQVTPSQEIQQATPSQQHSQTTPLQEKQQSSQVISASRPPKRNLFSPSKSPIPKKVLLTPTKIDGKSLQMQTIMERIKCRQIQNAQDIELLIKENRQLRAKNKELIFQINQFRKSEEEKQKREEDIVSDIFKDEMEF
eukprot:TCONS_00045628-protein